MTHISYPPVASSKKQTPQRPNYSKWAVISFVVVFSAIFVLSLYDEDDIKRLEDLIQKMEDKGLTEVEQKEYCRLKNKIDKVDYQECLESFKTGKAKRGKASTKDERKINPKRHSSHQQLIDSFTTLLKTPKYPPLTKKERDYFKDQIEHHKKQQKKSEPHGRNGKRR